MAASCFYQVSSGVPYNGVIKNKGIKRAGNLTLLLVVTFLLGYLVALSIRIGRQSAQDEARKADVIVVMGAAEYRGRPSPVLKLRLEHAVHLYQQKFAPLIMTTGGAGGDPNFTEAGVGRSYLTDRGIPAEAIIVEDSRDSTSSTLSDASEILKRMGLRTCIVVSDGYHIFRAKRILQKQGFIVYGSPREAGESSEIRKWWLYFRQAVGYALWQIGVRF